MPYQRSAAQKQFLLKLFAEQGELAKDNCHCPGCKTCEGFIPGCTCDHHIEAIPLFHKGRQKRDDPELPLVQGPAPVRRQPRRPPSTLQESILGRTEEDDDIPF